VQDWYEVAFDRLYPVIYRHRDAGEARRVASAFAPVFAGRSPVLDIACGAGRHMSAFGGHGINVFGLDLSSFLLERAAGEAGQAGRLVLGDMRVLPFRDGVFGGAVNMFTSFGYFESDDENRGVLAEVARVLAEGARFILDFANSKTVLSSEVIRSRREEDGYTIEEERRFEAGDRFVAKRVHVVSREEEVDLEYEERIRLFTPDELGSMLTLSGFTIERLHGDYDAGAFDPDSSERAIFVCRLEESIGG
jgi:SAM-dependent methyltransferase